MRIYFDACALNRLTDDQAQPRIRAEATAVEAILGLIAVGTCELISSTALKLELSRNPDKARSFDSLKLLSYAGALFQPEPSTIARAQSLEAAGYGAFDALHLACAEQSGCTVLLTTDDRFRKLAQRQVGQPGVEVANPVDWIRKAGWR